MDVGQAAKARRSVRSFKQDEVSPQLLAEMVDLARVGPSAANRQPLEYAAVTDAATREQVFQCLKWAAYTAPRGTPGPDAHPTAYIVVLRRKDLEIGAMAAYDVGAAVQTILLAAVEAGLGGCWLKSINVPKLTEILGLPEGVEIDSVVALGYPAEEPRLVDLAPDQEGLEVIKYWRDEADQQFVPKRALSKILHQDKYGG